MGEFGPWHLLIVAAVFVVLFGAKRLPDAARSLGRSARIMKTELRTLHDDEPAAVTANTTQPAEPVSH
jgi:sec-independent protein translocase protein TatA